MPYWQNVTRSFEIAWRHRYLWLLALFAGESGAGFNLGQGTGTTGNRNPGQAVQQFATWLGNHLGLVALLVVVWVMLVIALFILAAVCEGALIRACAEHDADRPFRLGMAWRNGLSTMWLIIRLRLLLIALVLPAIIVSALLVVAFVFAIVSSNPLLAVIIGLLALLFFLATFVYSVYLSLLDRLGSRTAILEQQGAVASLRRGHRLLFKRLGRVLLVWLISLAVGIAAGLASAIVLVVAAVPGAVAIVVLIAGGPTWVWVVVGLGVLIFLALALPINGFLAAQSSTYWTLAFRRMDVEYPPAYSSAPSPSPTQ